MQYKFTFAPQVSVISTENAKLPGGIRKVEGLLTSNWDTFIMGVVTYIVTLEASFKICWSDETFETFFNFLSHHYARRSF